MLSLKDRAWGEFYVGDLFVIEKGSKKSLSNEALPNEFMDYVGATSRNNGNVGFVSKKHNNLVIDGNCIVFINTAGTRCNCFWIVLTNSPYYNLLFYGDVFCFSKE